jgi:hypothetical protein
MYPNCYFWFENCSIWQHWQRLSFFLLRQPFIAGLALAGCISKEIEISTTTNLAKGDSKGKAQP